MKRYKVKFELMPFYIPPMLEQWLESGLPCDIRVKNGTHQGRRVKTVEITASDPESLEAMRRAFNKMIEARGYGPAALQTQEKR